MICTVFYFRNKIRGNEQFITIYLYFGYDRIEYISLMQTRHTCFRQEISIIFRNRTLKYRLLINRFLKFYEF